MMEVDPQKGMESGAVSLEIVWLVQKARSRQWLHPLVWCLAFEGSGVAEAVGAMVLCSSGTGGEGDTAAPGGGSGVSSASVLDLLLQEWEAGPLALTLEEGGLEGVAEEDGPSPCRPDWIGPPSCSMSLKFFNRPFSKFLRSSVERTVMRSAPKLSSEVARQTCSLEALTRYPRTLTQSERWFSLSNLKL